MLAGTRKKKKKEAEEKDDDICEGLSASFAQLNVLNSKTDLKHVGTPVKVSTENFSNGERGQTSIGEAPSASFLKLNVHKSKTELQHVVTPDISSENISNWERGQTSFGEALSASFSKLNVHTSKTDPKHVETPVKVSLENILNGKETKTIAINTPLCSYKRQTSFAQLNVHNSKTDLKHAGTPVIVLSESISNGERGQTSFGYPDFEIQTSLLNSLCCTLDHTTSPLHEEIKEHLDNVDIDTMAKGLLLDFKETSKLEVNSSSPIAEGINNTSDKLPVLTTSKLSALAENLEVAKTGNLEVTEVLKARNKAKAKNLAENLEVAKTDNLGDVTEVLKTGNKSKAENLEVAKTGNFGEATEVLKTGNKVKAENLEVARTGNFGEVTEVLKTGNMGKVSEVVKTGNMGEVTKVQESTKTTQHESKPRKGKSRRKGKNKTVKKVSAVMNFSHDDDENMMLSQVKIVKKVSADMDCLMIMKRK